MTISSRPEARSLAEALSSGGWRPSARFAVALTFLALLAGCHGNPFGLKPAAWERLHPTFAAPVHALLRDPDDPQLVYAGCGWQPISPFRQVGGLLRTTDGGDRWLDANGGLPQGVDIVALWFASAGFAGAGFAGAGDIDDSARPIVAETRDGGFFISTDRTTSWQPLDAPPEERSEVPTRNRDPDLDKIDGPPDVTVQVISRDPRDPRIVLAGTSAGIFRGRPGSPLALLIVALVAGLGLLTGTVLWRRSDYALAAATFRKVARTQNAYDRFTIVNQFGIDLPLDRRRKILGRLLRRLKRSRSRQFQAYQQPMQSFFDFLSGIELHGKQLRFTGSAQSLADAMESYAQGMTEAMTDDAPLIRAKYDSMALHEQLRFGAAIVRSENLQQLTAMRPALQELINGLTGSLDIPAIFLERLAELDDLLAVCEELARLPGVEDRALFLGQALTRSLSIRDRLSKKIEKGPTISRLFALVTIEGVRTVLATTLQDLQQRAELKLELRSRVLTARREAVVVLDVTNAGHGNAHNVDVELRSDDERVKVLRGQRGVKVLLRQQSARLEFLIEPTFSDRVRLVFRTTYSDQERQDHTIEFADIVEFRKPVEGSFVPLNPNPYVVGRPLGTGDIFVGRDDILGRIATSLGGVHQDNVVVLIGQRRMGKTSILRRLRDHLRDAYVPVMVDLQGLLAENDAEFFGEWIAVVQDELSEAGIEIEAPDDEELKLDPGGTFRRRFLRDVTRNLGERRLLMMIDEFEVLEERILAQSLSPKILPYLRSLMQHEQDVSFLFAGTHRLDELAGDYWGALFNLAVYLDVGHFSEQEVVQLFTGPTKATFQIDPLALDKAFRLTGGHPHFSQLLARELVELCNREHLSYVTVQDMRSLADEVIEKGQLHITYLWNEASRDERLLMLAVLELLDREGMASLTAVHRYLNDRGIAAGDLPDAARRLKRKEALQVSAGLLSFRMNLLQRWLQRNQSLELFALDKS